MAIEKKFKILIYPGLHTRPGAKFVQLCNKFESDIEIFFDDKVANGKSMTNIMTMAAPQNAQITVKVNGNQEILELNIDQEAQNEEKEVLEDLIISAINKAIALVKSKSQDKMNSVTGGLASGLKIPGM